jgi:N-acetylglucosamine kinase-like BadF-type ATPase
MLSDRAQAGTFTFIDEFEASLAAGLFGAGRWARGAPGVVVSAGTGSFCKGRNAAGDVRYAGGWGPLIGDEGSGYDIARETLRAVVMSADGRGEATALTRKALSHFGIDTPDDLKKALYDPPIARHELAALARYAFEAAEAGDTIAAEILAEAGRRLARLATPVITELFGEDKNFPVILSGGIFLSESAVDSALTPMLQALRRGADVFRSTLAPVMGAVATALDSLGVELSPRVVANLEAADSKMREADALGHPTPDLGRKGE